MNILPVHRALSTDTAHAFLFLLTAACLGACFVWAFWELKQMRERRRQLRRWNSADRFRS
jgi:hypothetical protein